MFAVIIQTTGQTASDKAQTLVAWHNGKTYAFNRDGVGNRGSAGAWRAGQGEATARVIGEPVAVILTAGDYADLDQFEATKHEVKPAVPSLLFQKSDRKVRGYSAVSPKTLSDVLADIQQSLLADPSGAGLAIFSGNRPTKPVATKVLASTPAVQVVAPVAPAPAIIPATPVANTNPAPAPVAVGAGQVQWATLSTPSITDTEVQSYRPRTNLLGGSVSEVDLFDKHRSASKTMSIVGHAGTGKTSSVRHYSALRGLPLVILECDIALDETQTEGTYIPTGNGNELAWAYSALATAIQQPSVILLNELSRLAPKNASLFLGLLAERQLTIGQRQGEVIKVHPECLIVADMNPVGYSGVSKQDQALLDRFDSGVEYTYDLAIDRIWCKSESFLTEVVAKWRESVAIDPTATPFSHRLTKSFSWMVANFGLRPAVLTLLQRFTKSEQDALKLSIQKSAIEIASEFGVDADNIHINL